MSIGLQYISGAAIKMQNIKPNKKEFILLNYSFAWIEFIKNLWLFICNIKGFIKLIVIESNFIVEAVPHQSLN